MNNSFSRVKPMPRHRHLLARNSALPVTNRFLAWERSLRRPLLALASCALLGLPLTTARAQDAPKPTDPAKPAAGQPAQTPPAPAAPAAPAPTPPGTVTISGLLDFYFGFNARSPAGAAGGPFTGTTTPSGEFIGIDNAGRSFDTNDREFTFALGELNITRTEGKGFPLGATVTLTVGDTARLVHATEPGGTSSWQTIQQAYITKTPHFLGRDITLDFGKFVTPFGYEVIESVNNDNYSRSFGFQYAIPLYHAGLRATVPLNAKWQLLGGIVNGWNNVADDNDGKSGFLQLTWKPTGTVTGIFGVMGGPEGTGAYGPVFAPKDTTQLSTWIYEAQGIWQTTSALKLAGDIVYGQGYGNVPPAAGVAGPNHVSGDWLSLAGYARYQFTPRLAGVIRVEQFEDIPGPGGVGLRLGGGYTRLRDLTLTAEYTFLHSHLVTRLEYRHDHSNTAFFGTGNGSATPDQDTLYASGVYKF